VPGAPTALSATPGNAEAALTWVAPASNGGSAITGYTVMASPGGRTCATTGAVACTVTGLTNGTGYSFTVTATNVAGTGPASSPISATPSAVPGPPTNAKAARDSSLGIDLTWKAPTANGGSAITGYRIYRGTTSTSQTFIVAVGNVLSYVDASTTRGTRYYYRVTADNAAGEGPTSSTVNAIAR